MLLQLAVRESDGWGQQQTPMFQAKAFMNLPVIAWQPKTLNGKIPLVTCTDQRSKNKNITRLWRMAKLRQAAI